MLAALLFSTGGAAIKAADFTAWQVASFRSGIAAVTLLILAPRALRGFGWKAALVGLAYAATLITFVLANRMTTSANTIYLQSTAPLYLLLLGPWLLKEPVRRRDIPVIISVFGGLLLVFMGLDHPSATAPDPARGNLLALLSGITYALMLCGLRWLGRDGEGGSDRSVAAVVLGNVFACIAVLPMALPAGAHTAVAWSMLFYLGIFQLSCAYLLVSMGIRHLTALEVSLFLLVETAFNPVWAWLFLREVPGTMALAGGALIIGSTAWQASRSEKHLPAIEPA